MKIPILHFFRLTITFSILLILNQAIAAQAKTACEMISGKWKWFTGYEVTFHSDGTLVHNPGNDGTWQCLDSSRGEILIKWRVGNYMNKMALTEDGNELFSLDSSQTFVKATRIQEAPSNEPKHPTEGIPADPPSTPPQQNQTPKYNLSPEDAKELGRLMKRMNGDFTYTKQAHWPDGTVSDDGYLIATMSLTLREDFALVQKYLKCKVSNPGWRTDGYVMSANTMQDCDKNLHGLKWEEQTETAPLAQIDTSSIQVKEIDKHASGSSLALDFSYVGFDANAPFEIPKGDDSEGDTEVMIKIPPGFTILRCRNRGTCGQMAGDLKMLAEIAKKYVPSSPTTKP